MPDALPTQAPMADGSGVLYESDSGTVAHISILGRNRKQIVDLGTVPATPQSQISFDAISPTAVAFIYNPTNGPTASTSWNLYLWTTTSRSLRRIATNPVDSQGKPLNGGWVLPVLTDRYLYWIQASADTSGWGGSSLMQYNLASGRIRALYRGLTESFVPYNNLVLFTGIEPHVAPFTPNSTSHGPPEQMYAVDQDTGASATVPAGITAATDVANNMITDGNMIIWNTWQGGLRAWTPAWHRSITLVPDIGWSEGIKLSLGAAAMPRLYGHFLVFNPSETYVLDLRTNSFAQVIATPDSEDVTGSQLAVEAYTTPTSFNRSTGAGTFDQYIINLAPLPDLPGCS